VTHNTLDSVPKCREQTLVDSGLLECPYVLLGVWYILSALSGIRKSVKTY
jgi:hypothetical protein